MYHHEEATGRRGDLAPETTHNKGIATVAALPRNDRMNYFSGTSSVIGVSFFASTLPYRSYSAAWKASSITGW